MNYIKKFADWSKAPKWANYHTVDKSGVGCWWETLPSPEYAEWYTEASTPEASGAFALDGAAWDDTLETRPADVVKGYDTADDPYAQLRSVLDLAYDQSAKGKGKERHANARPFVDQPIMQISRMVGLGFPTGQVQKKVQEAGGMVKAGRPEAAQAELLGAIVYCVAAWLLIQEGK